MYRGWKRNEFFYRPTKRCIEAKRDEWDFFISEEVRPRDYLTYV